MPQAPDQTEKPLKLHFLEDAGANVVGWRLSIQGKDVYGYPCGDQRTTIAHFQEFIKHLGEELLEDARAANVANRKALERFRIEAETDEGEW